MADAHPTNAFPRDTYLDVAPRKAAADEIAGYDAVLFGECATAAQSRNLQTLAMLDGRNVVAGFEQAGLRAVGVTRFLRACRWCTELLRRNRRCIAATINLHPVPKCKKIMHLEK